MDAPHRGMVDRCAPSMRTFDVSSPTIHALPRDGRWFRWRAPAPAAPFRTPLVYGSEHGRTTARLCPMLIDANDLAPGHELTSQVCIIGAGAAGIVAARYLAERAIDVVLLEGGGFEPTPESVDLYRGSVSGAPLAVNGPADLTANRLRYFGGSTNHWGGFCAPLGPNDFAERPWLGISGWPIDDEMLAPYYVRATEIVGLPHTTFDPMSWPEMSTSSPRPLDHPDLVWSAGQVRPRRFGTEDRASIVDSARATLVLHASATRLDLAPGSDRIESVEFASPAGTRFRAVAPIVVLAMGGIENARLLLASNQVATNGIGNEYDQVGRYFCDHVSTLGAFVALGGTPAAWAELQSVNAGSAILQRTLRLSSSAQEADGLPGAGVVLFAEPLTTARQVDGLRLRDVDGWMQITGSPPVGTIASILVAAEQPLDAGSRVTLTRERDALGVPRVDLHWRQSPLERRAIRRALFAIAAAFGATGHARVQLALGTLKPAHAESGSKLRADYTIDTAAVDADEFLLEPGNHHMCTTRMSASPRTGVVDADCRVHGIANLYVAGSSVFATGGIAPPTLTIIALALRLGDHVSGILRP